VYAYAKAGFGDYMGFSSAWGYWISAWLGNVGYFVLLFSTLGSFPRWRGQHAARHRLRLGPAVGRALSGLRGIKEAAFINQVTTVAKVVPLMFVVIAAFAFGRYLHPGHLGLEQPPVRQRDGPGAQHDAGHRVRVHRHRGRQRLLGRAERRSDVGKATVIGFLGVLALLVLVNVLSLGS
jgi:arginine:ornithine antiporter/lysine permease